MIHTKWFDGNGDLTDAHYIRTVVFVDEQGISLEEEFDGTDACAIHLVAYEDGAPVATGRILKADGQLIIGRIATVKEHRKKGYGDLIVRMLIRKAFSMGEQTQHIHAQKAAQGFYEKLGFVAYGDVYDEAGIEHISMVHEGDVGGHCL